LDWLGRQSEIVETESEEKAIVYNLLIDVGPMIVEGSAGGILSGEHT
jgi:hypothetical protein